MISPIFEAAKKSSESALNWPQSSALNRAIKEWDKSEISRLIKVPARRRSTTFPAFFSCVSVQVPWRKRFGTQIRLNWFTSEKAQKQARQTTQLLRASKSGDPKNHISRLQLFFLSVPLPSFLPRTFPVARVRIQIFCRVLRLLIRLTLHQSHQRCKSLSSSWPKNSSVLNLFSGAFLCHMPVRRARYAPPSTRETKER